MTLSGGHGSKNWVRDFNPRASGQSERTTNPEIRSADLIVAPLFCVRTPDFTEPFTYGSPKNLTALWYKIFCFWALERSVRSRISFAALCRPSPCGRSEE